MTMESQISALAATLGMERDGEVFSRRTNGLIQKMDPVGWNVTLVPLVGGSPGAPFERFGRELMGKDLARWMTRSDPNAPLPIDDREETLSRLLDARLVPWLEATFPEASLRQTLADSDVLRSLAPPDFLAVFGLAPVQGAPSTESEITGLLKGAIKRLGWPTKAGKAERIAEGVRHAVLVDANSRLRVYDVAIHTFIDIPGGPLPSIPGIVQTVANLAGEDRPPYVAATQPFAIMPLDVRREIIERIVTTSVTAWVDRLESVDDAREFVRQTDPADKLGAFVNWKLHDALIA